MGHKGKEESIYNFGQKMSREEEGDPGTDVWHKNKCSRLELKKDGHSTFKCFTLAFMVETEQSQSSVMVDSK